MEHKQHLAPSIEAFVARQLNDLVLETPLRGPSATDFDVMALIFEFLHSTPGDVFHYCVHEAGNRFFPDDRGREREEADAFGFPQRQ